MAFFTNIPRLRGNKFHFYTHASKWRISVVPSASPDRSIRSDSALLGADFNTHLHGQLFATNHPRIQKTEDPRRYCFIVAKEGKITNRSRLTRVRTADPSRSSINRSRLCEDRLEEEARRAFAFEWLALQKPRCKFSTRGGSQDRDAIRSIEPPFDSPDLEEMQLSLFDRVWCCCTSKTR